MFFQHLEVEADNANEHNTTLDMDKVRAVEKVTCRGARVLYLNGKTLTQTMTYINLHFILHLLIDLLATTHTSSLHKAIVDDTQYNVCHVSR